MSRVGKVVSVAILTVFLYAFGIYFQKGAFIFPFPLNEIIFCISLFSMGYSIFKTEKVLFSVFLLAGFFHLLSNEFYWTFIFGNPQMEQFSNSILKDIFLLCYYGCLLIAFVFTSLKFNQIWVRLLVIIPIVLLLFGLSFRLPLLDTISFLLISIYVVKRIEEYPILNVWFLIFVLNLTKFWSLMS